MQEVLKGISSEDTTWTEKAENVQVLPLLGFEWVSYQWWRWLVSRLRGFGESVQPFIPRQHFIFFKVEISSHTLIPFFMSGSISSSSAS